MWLIEKLLGTAGAHHLIRALNIYVQTRLLWSHLTLIWPLTFELWIDIIIKQKKTRSGAWVHVCVGGPSIQNRLFGSLPTHPKSHVIILDTWLRRWLLILDNVAEINIFVGEDTFFLRLIFFTWWRHYDSWWRHWYKLFDTCSVKVLFDEAVHYWAVTISFQVWWRHTLWISPIMTS